MSDNQLQKGFTQEPLTFLDHMDPEKHYFGEALFAPADEETTSASAVKTAGISQAPARADHSHGVDSLLAIYGYNVNITGPAAFELTGGTYTPTEASVAEAWYDTHIKPPYDGIISVSGGVYFSAASWTNAEIRVQLRRYNSSAVLVGDYFCIVATAPLSGNGFGCPIQETFEIDAGDYLVVYVYVGNTVSTNFLINSLVVKYERIF